MLEPIDPNDADAFQKHFGPGVIDSQLRSLIQMCWFGLPDEKRTVENLEVVFRNLVDRAFRDLRDDRDTFGLK